MNEQNGSAEQPIVPQARPAMLPVAASVASAHTPAPVFYSLNSSKVTLGEYMWGGPAPLAILGWVLAKCFRVKAQGSTDDPPVETLNDFEVSSVALPASVKQRLAPLAQELATAGFRLAVCHAIDNALQSTRTYLITLGHPAVPVVARLHLREWSLRSPPKEVLFTEFITAFPNGEFIWSLSSKPDMLAPPSCRIVRRVGAAPIELWKAHEQELTAHASRRAALPASSQGKVREVCGRLHAAVRDFHVQRGVFVPLTKTEKERFAATQAAHQGAVVAGSQHPEIIAEMNRLQHKQTGWKGALAILIVSMFLFMGMGVPDQPHSWRMLLLIPVLLFHECGHFLAMKASGYRNLRMFFIPGFGAAVSGQHFNVPGWKKAVVSLMGPLPGILAGIPLGLYGAIWDKPLAVDAALLLLILNGLNLLPVLPLDGGHLVHTILFSRNQVLDVVFRIAAAFLLAVLAAVFKDRVLFFLVIAMFAGLPWALINASMVRQLRREGFESVSPDSTSIPPAVADRIIAKLRSATKKPLANKIVARRTLEIFETLNTRPPGWAASAGLITVHLLSFMAALVFAVGFTFTRLNAGGGFFHAVAYGPKHPISVAAIRGAPAVRTGETQSEIRTVVATFTRTAQAAGAYDDVAPRLRFGETATLFGDTLLIRLSTSDDRARERWIADLQPRAADVFVDGGTMRAIFRFSFISQDEQKADAIVEELQTYFQLPLSEGLVPPWSRSMALTPDQVLARKTYSRLRISDSYNDPLLAALRAKLTEAARRGQEAEVKSLSEQLREATAEVERRRLRRIAEDGSGEVDQELARQYLALYERLKPIEFYKTAPKELAPRFGLSAASGDSSDSEGDTTWARSGFVSRTGLLVQLEYVSFYDAVAGATALAAWLDARSLHSMYYDVQGDSEFEGDIDDEEDELDAQQD